MPCVTIHDAKFDEDEGDSTEERGGGLERIGDELFSMRTNGHDLSLTCQWLMIYTLKMLK